MTYTVTRPFSHEREHYTWGQKVEMEPKHAAPLVNRGLLAETAPEPEELDMGKVLGAFDQKKPKKK